MTRIKKEQAEVHTYNRLRFFCQGYLELHFYKIKVVPNQFELKDFIIVKNAKSQAPNNK